MVVTPLAQVLQCEQKTLDITSVQQFELLWFLRKFSKNFPIYMYMYSYARLLCSYLFILHTFYLYSILHTFYLYSVLVTRGFNTLKSSLYKNFFIIFILPFSVSSDVKSTSH